MVQKTEWSHNWYLLKTRYWELHAAQYILSNRDASVKEETETFENFHQFRRLIKEWSVGGNQQEGDQEDVQRNDG